MNHRSLLCLLVMLAPLVAKGTENTPANVVVEARLVSLPQDVALPLIRKFRSAKAAERAEALGSLDESIAGGRAKLHGWPVLTTSAGTRAVAEDVDELRYATEFQAERLTVHVREEDEVFSNGPREERAIDSEPLATSFETRNLGVTLEVEPIVHPEGQSLTLNLELAHVRLKEIERIAIVRESLAEKKTSKITQEQPRFTTLKVTTQFSLRDGDVKLVGVFKSPEGENQLELFVIRAEIAKN